MQDVKDHVASACGSLENLLLKLKMLCEERPDEFESVYPRAAHQAVEFARAAALEALYASAETAGKPSLLHHAVACGCVEACDALLSRCPRLNFSVDESGQTALQKAAKTGLCRTVRLLLLHGADASHRDFEGCTALHLASAHGRVETCQLLLSSAPQSSDLVNARTRAGLTPLQAAAQSGSAGVSRVLQEAKADPSLEDVSSGGHLAYQAPAVGSEGGGCLPSAAFSQQLAAHETTSSMTFSQQLPPRVAEAEEEELYRKWRQRFEPVCRSKMNVAARDAFLEIGRPRLIGATSKALRFACRVVDTMGLLKQYSVELAAHSAIPAQRAETLQLRAKVARRTRTAAVDGGDEVEFIVTRRQSLLDPGPCSLRWDQCHFRVVGDLLEHPARRIHMAGCQARSPWAMPLKFTSRFT